MFDPDVHPGEVRGPRFLGLRGTPRHETVWPHLTDTAVAERLWDATRELTGVDPAGVRG